MERPLKARLGAARLMLMQQTAGSPTHKAVSGIQCAAIVDLVHTQSLGPEVKAEICQLALAMPWADGDLDKLLSQLASGDHPIQQRRRASQDWTAIMSYGDAAFWSRMTSAATPKDEKLHVVLELAIGLGLRLPSEPSVKLLCSLWMASAEAPATLAGYTSQQKAVLYKYTKDTFRRLVRGRRDPPTWMTALPVSPSALQREAPYIWRSRYAAGDPVPAAIDTNMVHELNGTYTCRGGVIKHLPQQAAVTPEGRMVEYMMDRLMGGGMQHGSSDIHLQMQGQMQGRGRQPRSLASLQSFEVPPSTLQPVEVPPNTVQLALPPMPLVEEVSPSASERTQFAHGLGPAAGGVQSLLHAFGQRDVDKAAAAAAQRVRKRPAAAAFAPAPLAILPQPAPAAIADAVDVPHGPAAIPGEPWMGLYGCSKCRGSHSGCRQCKLASFKGRRWQR